MRKVSLASEVGKHVEFSGEFKIRDEKALKRIMSGLIKLLFPDEQFDNSEAEAGGGAGSRVQAEG